MDAPSEERSTSTTAGPPWWAWFPWPLMLAWYLVHTVMPRRADIDTLALFTITMMMGAVGTIWLTTRLRSPFVVVSGPGFCRRCRHQLGPARADAPHPEHCPECGSDSPSNRVVRAPMSLAAAVVAGVLVGITFLHLIFSVVIASDALLRLLR